MNLSEVIDRFHCSGVQAQTLDPLLAFGVYLTGKPHPRTDVEKLLDLGDERRQFMAGPGRLNVPDVGTGSITVDGQEIVNDLYVAKVHRDQDKVVRVRIPACGPLLSTWAAERDWRLLMIALFSVLGRAVAPSVKALAEENVVLEICWSERVVMASVRPAFWQMVANAITFALRDRPVTAGQVCDRCQVRGSCQAYERLLELPAEETLTGLSKGDAAQKLLLALTLARASEKAVVERRRSLARKLAALTTDGRIDVHGLFTIPVEAGNLERYPYGPTRAALESHGAWRDDYGAIALRPFKAAIPTMKTALQQRLASLKIVDTKEPDIKEIVDGVANSVQAPNLRGVRL